MLPQSCPVRTDYNPFDQAQKRDPFPFYAHARHNTPIFFSPILNMWVVTRYEDILAALKEPTIFSSLNIIESPTPLPPDVLEILSLGIPFVPALINNIASERRWGGWKAELRWKS